MQTDSFDILLIDADEQRALFTLRAIQAAMPVRCAQKSTARGALVSFQRARFNAIVCRAHFQDLAAHHWVRMIRSGKFGFAATPLIILCDEAELHELRPMVDELTTLVSEADTPALVTALRAAESGTDRPTVLIVEDESLAALAAASALEKAYRVEIASDGASALQMWRAKRHAVVVLDLMLPDRPGLEVLGVIIAEYSEQVVIVLTAHDAPETHQELILAGASDFLSKPVDLHALPEVCANALRASQCMTNAARSRAEASQLSEVSARVRAANYHFERGQTARGRAQLHSALFATRAYLPDDDQWAHLLSEFDAS